MVELDLAIVKEIDFLHPSKNKTVEVSAKSGSYKHTYIEESNG